MDKLERTKRLLNEAEHELAETERRITDEGEKNILLGARSSLERQISQLRSELGEFKNLIGREIIEFRLRGSTVNDGSIPLHFLANFSKSFSYSLYASAYRYRYGKDVRGRFPASFISELNLRFRDIAQGSTKLIVSGDTSADLFGYSILEESLSTTFSLLRSETDSDLHDQAAELGGRSVRHLRQFLNVIDKNGSELEMNWRASDLESYSWIGTSERLQLLGKKLELIEIDREEDVSIRGRIVLLSRKGKMEIETSSGEVLKCTYPQRIFSEIQELHLNQTVSMILTCEVSRSLATDEVKSNYSIKEILEY